MCFVGIKDYYGERCVNSSLSLSHDRNTAQPVTQHYLFVRRFGNNEEGMSVLDDGRETKKLIFIIKKKRQIFPTLSPGLFP